MKRWGVLAVAFVLGHAADAHAQLVRPSATPRATAVGQTPGNCTDSNVALWEDFEETSGNLTVPSGCAASGTVLTATSITYAQAGTAGLGRAVLLNATNDGFTSTSDVNALDATTAIVVETWIRYQGNTPAVGVASVSATINKQDGSLIGWGLEVSIDGTNDPAFTVADADADTCVVHWGSDPFGDLQWHRLRAVWNGTTCTLQVDNDAAASNTIEVNGDGVITTIANADPFEIVASGVTGTATLYIADLRVTIGNTTNDLGYNTGGRSPVP